MTVTDSVFAEEKLQQLIEKQLRYNSRKNVFYSGEKNKLEFLNETLDFIQILKNFPVQEKEKMIEFTVDKVLNEFYKINQYYRFDTNSQYKLKQIYRNLMDNIIKSDEQTPIDVIANNHYSALQNWLSQSNPFATSIYPENVSVIDEVVCAEYSAETQLAVLGLELSSLAGSILDVGCGAKAKLVNYLAEAGFEVQGIDRNVETNGNLTKADWLNFTFAPNHWKTIISNLGFSNHFRHHHQRNDGDFISYAQKYIEILQAIKPGGTFYYAPDLPFIETYLDPAKYEISKHKIPSTDYYSVKIKRRQ